MTEERKQSIMETVILQRISELSAEISGLKIGGFQCSWHTGLKAEEENLCRRCDELQETNKEQWNSIGDLEKTKVSNSSMKWVVGIFIVIALSVVGFMWRSQEKLTEKFEDSQNKIMIKIESIRK